MITRIKLLMTAIFWGGTFIAGRIVATNIDPFAAAFLRFFIASVFLLTATRRVEGRFPPVGRKQIFPIFLLGMTGIFTYNVFFFSGLHYISAGRAAIIIANNPIFIGLLSSLIFREKLTPLKLFGIIISVSGAVIVISRGEILQIFSEHLGLGDLFIFGCVASWVIYTLLGKVVMGRLSPLVSVTYASVAGTLALFFPALYRGMFSAVSTYTAPQWLSLFYLGFFGTVLGFLWYYQGINTIGPMKASIFINFVPISAVILAFFILNEPVTLSLLAGVVLVSSGVYFTNVSALRSRIRRKARTIRTAEKK